MAKHLVVVASFGPYVVGQQITDAAVMAAMLRDHSQSVRAVGRDDPAPVAPAHAPAPAHAEPVPPSVNPAPAAHDAPAPEVHPASGTPPAAPAAPAALEAHGEAATAAT